MWDERYSSDEFAYGTEPNRFLAENARRLTGPVLSLAEGEGRNAVFLATLGLEVLGVDSSGVGLAKAQKLATRKEVSIQTQVADLAVYTPPESAFGSVVSIYAHLPSVIRQRLYPLVQRALKPGGILLLEAYSKAQATRNTGGPKDLDLLMSVEILRDEFPALEIVALREVERDVVEGRFHTGLASVVQLIGRKKA